MRFKNLAAIASFVFITSTLISPLNAAGNAVYGFQWTQGTAIITPELMGIPNDGKDKAGVDQTIFIDGNGKLRLIFAGPNNTKHSAVSPDNGNTWAEDKNFKWPVFSIDSGPGAYVAVSPAPEGGYRAFVAFGTKGLASAYSSDGQIWKAETGIRLLPSDFGLQKITSSNPIKLSDGTFRMYIGDDSDYFKNCAQDSSVTTNIYSAVSKDQLKWTVEPGIRIGSNVTKLCKLHPQAFIDNDGKYGVVYSVTNSGGQGPFGYMTSCFESKSNDGVTFDSGALVPVGLNGNTALSANSLNCSDPSMFIMPDKSALFFYALFGPIPEGDRIIMSIGSQSGSGSSTSNGQNGNNNQNSSGGSITNVTANPSSPSAEVKSSATTTSQAAPTQKSPSKQKTITCVKGKIKKTINGTNPKCPSGYKQI